MHKDVLHVFHSLAARIASPEPPFCTLEELEEMRLAVLREDRQTQAEEELEQARRLVGSTREEAAGNRRRLQRRRVRIRRHRPVPGRPHRSTRATRRDAHAAAALAIRPAADPALPETGVVPVPLLEGDRHHVGPPAVEWPGLSDLLKRLATGRAEDVAGLVRHTGLTAAPDQTAAALAACESTGLEEIVTGLVQQAVFRPDKDLIIILQNLHTLGRHRLVGRILEWAREAGTASAA
ncbi:hypothetical protein [Streptomyces sp. NPDC002644]